MVVKTLIQYLFTCIGSVKPNYLINKTHWTFSILEICELTQANTCILQSNQGVINGPCLQLLNHMRHKIKWIKYSMVLCCCQCLYCIHMTCVCVCACTCVTQWPGLRYRKMSFFLLKSQHNYSNCSDNCSFTRQKVKEQIANSWEKTIKFDERKSGAN